MADPSEFAAFKAAGNSLADFDDYVREHYNQLGIPDYNPLEVPDEVGDLQRTIDDGAQMLVNRNPFNRG